MIKRVKVKEFFTSIQGEGPYIGYKQLFIRFCTCNLNCKFCDTEFQSNSTTKEYSANELFEAINKLDLKNLHSVSLTGGEPLLQTEFLKEFLPLLKQLGLKIYLETNGTLFQKLEEILDFVDIVSADIKLESATNISGLLNLHDKFFALCHDKDTFGKIVFDKNITDDEIEQTSNFAQKHNIELILSPMMLGNKMSVTGEFVAKTLDKYLHYYEKVRVIPQVHKFLGVE